MFLSKVFLSTFFSLRNFLRGNAQKVSHSYEEKSKNNEARNASLFYL